MLLVSLLLSLSLSQHISFVLSLSLFLSLSLSLFLSVSSFSLHLFLFSFLIYCVLPPLSIFSRSPSLSLSPLFFGLPGPSHSQNLSQKALGRAERALQDVPTIASWASKIASGCNCDCLAHLGPALLSENLELRCSFWSFQHLWVFVSSNCLNVRTEASISKHDMGETQIALLKQGKTHRSQQGKVKLEGKKLGP